MDQELNETTSRGALYKRGELLNGTSHSESFNAYQCGSCVKLSSEEMLTMAQGNPSEFGNYLCPHCMMPMVSV